MCVSHMWMWRVCVTHINETCVCHTIFETCVRHTCIRVVCVSHTSKRDMSVSQYSSRMCDTNVNETCVCHTIYETRVCRTCQCDVWASHVYYARHVCEIHTTRILCETCVWNTYYTTVGFLLFMCDVSHTNDSAHQGCRLDPTYASCRTRQRPAAVQQEHW